MLVTPHAVTGATIGSLVSNPLLAASLSFSSHYLLDTVPHWQETLAPYIPSSATWARIPLDLGMSVLLAGSIARAHPQRAGLIWACAVAAGSPDLDSLLYALPKLAPTRGFFKRYLHWHVSIQRETASPWGLVPQIGLILFCLAVARRHES